jgi:hypothetical protein
MTNLYYFSKNELRVAVIGGRIYRLKAGRRKLRRITAAISTVAPPAVLMNNHARGFMNMLFLPTEVDINQARRLRLYYYMNEEQIRLP